MDCVFILSFFFNFNSFFFPVQFQALDDSVMTNVRNLNKKAPLRSPMSKENYFVPAPGSKRVIGINN